MQILIVEDELLIAEMLKEMLNDLGYVVVGIVKNYKQAIAALENNASINFCFLDINLKTEKTGLDIAAIINEKFNIPFVFLTSYSDKTTIANAMAYKPQAYLIKPFTEVDLFTTLELVKSRQGKVANLASETIMIKDGAKSIKLNTDEVLWVKSDNIYLEIKTVSKTFIVRNSLVQFLEELTSNLIVRVHRTFAVNINKVQAISGSNILIGENKIPLSRKYRNEVFDKFKI